MLEENRDGNPNGLEEEELDYNPPATQEEEKLEFLKREEIRTMQKDIARLREIEAQKERERVAVIKTEEKIKIPTAPSPEKPKEEIPKVEKIPLDTLIPKPPRKRPSPLTKFLVRGLIVIFCFLFVGFFYWFLEIRKPTKEGAPPPTEEEVSLPFEEIEEKPEIIVPPALIQVEETKISEISKIEEIPEIFNQLMKEELAEGSLTRVAIKNLAENRLASLEDLSLAFEIEIPEEIFSKLDPDFTFLIFNQKQGKRVALIGKVKEKEGLSELLKNWETKIRNEGFSFSGKKIPTLASYFRTAFYQGIGFRYLTISKIDFGICYAWTPDDYFIVTTSFESLQRVIDEIKPAEEVKSEESRKIGQLFIIGFEEKTLTPELEETFKKYRPGGVLLLSENIESAEQLKSLIQDLQNLSLKETGLPLFIAVDQEGGLISRIDFLSEKTSQSEIKDLEQAYQVGLNRGQELKELGINLNLAPVLDITEEGDFLFSRTFQKSAGETGELAKALILGQKKAGILTAIKHFPGYGGITFQPEDTLATLDQIPEISQFEKAMEANPEFIMTANAIYKTISPSLPFTFSPAAIQFLKSNTSPEVLLVSDDLAQDSLLNRFSLEEIVTKPIEAGVDVLIFSGWDIKVSQGLDAFSKAFQDGKVSKEKIERAISRITKLKENLLKPR